MQFEAIAYIQSDYKKKYEAPKQAHLEKATEAVILLNAHCNYESALEDLEGFSHIWLIYHFHQNKNWRPKVLPPRNTRKKKGLFATRSPYRPNPIGMSVVKLKRVEGRKVFISDHDLLDGTPILDIKPYLAYSDSHPHASLGWIEDIDELEYKIFYKNKSEEALNWLTERGIQFKYEIERRLSYDPFPHPYRRITKFENHYQMRYKEWCANYKILNQEIHIDSVYSGFSDEKIAEEDFDHIHRNFNDHHFNQA